MLEIDRLTSKWGRPARRGQDRDAAGARLICTLTIKKGEEMNVGRYLFCAVLALAPVGSLGVAQDSDLMNTRFAIDAVTDKGEPLYLTLYNGRMWVRLSEKEKESLLAGIRQGISAFCVTSGACSSVDQSEYNEVRKSYMGEGLLPAELASIITAMYADTSNIRIPITEMIRVAASKARGSSALTIANELVSLRKKSAL